MFKHGDNVIIFDAYGHHRAGTLHLPDQVQYTGNGSLLNVRKTDGSYGVHTLNLPGGRKYRTEGRLYSN